MIIYIIIITVSFLLGIFFFKKNHYHGPNSNIYKKYIYKIEHKGLNKYYKFTPTVCICPSSTCVKNK